MQIVYDKDLKIAGIGMVPWARLGLEQWLPNYAIASLYDWDLPEGQGTPPLYTLSSKSKPLPNLKKINTQNLLKNPDFQEILNKKLADYDLLTYKPIMPPAVLKNRKFIMADPYFTKTYENKVWFREKFQKEVNFSPFIIYDRQSLKTSKVFFQKLMAGRQKVILQDEQLSGAKGTFEITNHDQYKQALETLGVNAKRKVVVSQAIESARERSVQCCISKGNILIGPVQRQIIAHPLLGNKHLPGDKFCGITIDASDQQTPLYKAIVGISKKIGTKMQKDGYRGIFGIDFLLDDSNRLYVLEVNARITGATPLLTELNRQDTSSTPFYLLHVLELGGYDYSVINEPSRISVNGSLLLLHSLNAINIKVTHVPTSGTYTLKNGKPVLVSRNIHIGKLRNAEFIFQGYIPSGVTVKPGGRLANLLFSEPVIDDKTDKLYNHVVETIKTVRKEIAITKPG